MSALVFGGLTVVGVEMVRILVDSQQFSHIRVVDRWHYETASISDDYKAYFRQIDFRQANASIDDAVSRCFDKNDGQPFDMVFNCVVVTHQDHGSEYYRLFVYQIVDNIARQVEMRNIRVFVHQASANHYVPRTNYEENDESDEIRSYNLPSKYKMMAEQAILQRDVNAVIARTAVVYGPTDRSGITTELLIAYMISRDQIELPAKMEPDKPHYTIHAIDAARAMLHLAKWYVQHQCEDVQVFNVCDVGRTTVIDFNRRYAEIYPHKFRYLPIPRAVPSLKQQEDVREMTNEFFGERWLRILREANIKQAPVSPFAYRESVSPAAIAVSNARLVATGFTFKYPVLTANALRQTIYEFTKQGVWPTATGPIPPPSNLN